jgi:hypothetical protein
MTHVRGLLQLILDRQLPYAAVAMDRHSNCLLDNRAAGRAPTSCGSRSIPKGAAAGSSIDLRSLRTAPSRRT